MIFFGVDGEARCRGVWAAGRVDCDEGLQSQCADLRAHGRVLAADCRVGEAAGSWGDEGKTAGGAELVGAEGFERCGGVAAGAEFLVAVLELIELPVEATLGEELLVSAALA